MTREAVIRQLQELADASDVDEHALNTNAVDAGSDLEGLALLVDAAVRSRSQLLARAATFALARALWNLTNSGTDLTAVVLRFVNAFKDTTDAGTLIGLTSALQGLSAMVDRWRPSGGRPRGYLAFPLNCLHHADSNVRGSCLDLLGHLVDDETLPRLIGSGTLRELMARVRDIHAYEAEEFASELAALRGLMDDGEIR